MTFKELTRKSHSYFGLKLPPEETGTLWSEEVGRYPGEFYDWCYSRLKSSTKKVMDNFPKSVSESWGEWLSRHPEKVADSEFSCSEKFCDRGLLFMLNSNGQSYVFRCGACVGADISHSSIRKAYLGELIDEGWIKNTIENLKKFRIPYDPTQWRRKSGGDNGFKWDEEN